MAKKIFKILLLLILSGTFFPLFSSEVHLKNTLGQAEAGNFVVILQGRHLSLLHILSSENDSLVIEEISAPVKIKSKIKGDWQSWLDKSASGHTSWVLYELNLKNCQIEEVYSCTQKAWKKVFPQEQIFPTLVNLAFTPIDPSKRKRVGPPVPGGMLDNRPLWQPPVFFEGKKLKDIPCEALAAHWPNDGTDLSGKKIEIFLTQKQKDLPFFFPIWMQVSDKVGRAKLRVIDAGAHLNSPNKKLPIPPPELTACSFTSEGHLQFILRSHPSFEHFKVYVKELGTPSCFTLPYSEEAPEDSRLLRVLIENEDLNNKLKLDKLYTFIFEPENYPQLAIETPKPIKLLKQYATK